MDGSSGSHWTCRPNRAVGAWRKPAGGGAVGRAEIGRGKGCSSASGMIGACRFKCADGKGPFGSVGSVRLAPSNRAVHRQFEATAERQCHRPEAVGGVVQEREIF